MNEVGDGFPCGRVVALNRDLIALTNLNRLGKAVGWKTERIVLCLRTKTIRTRTSVSGFLQCETNQNQTTSELFDS